MNELEEQRMGQLQQGRMKTASGEKVAEIKSALSFGKKVSQHWLLLVGALFACTPSSQRAVKEIAIEESVSVQSVSPTVSNCGNVGNRVLLTFDDWPYGDAQGRFVRFSEVLRTANVGAIFFRIQSPANSDSLTPFGVRGQSLLFCLRTSGVNKLWSPLIEARSAAFPVH